MGRGSKTKLTTLLGMMIISTMAITASILVLVNKGTESSFAYRVSNSPIPIGYHYSATDATRTSKGIKEYWVACNTHDHYFLEDPEADEIDFINDISNDSATGFTVQLSDPYWLGASSWDGSGISAAYPTGKGISAGDTSNMGEISFTFASAYSAGESITIKEGSTFVSDVSGSDVEYGVANCYTFTYNGSTWSLAKTPVYGEWHEALSPIPDTDEFDGDSDDRWERYDKFDFDDGFVYGSQSAVDNSVYSKVNAGGRKNVGKFEPTTVGWEQVIEVYQASHLLDGYRKYGPEDDPNGSAAKATRKGMILTNNYHYVTFDIYLSDGADVPVCAPFYTGNSAIYPFDWYGANYTRLWADDELTYTDDAAENSNVSVYDLDGNQVTYTNKETWYRVVVAYNVNMNDDGTDGHFASINLHGTNINPVYLDNVRCYHDASWQHDFNVERGITGTLSEAHGSTYTPTFTNVECFGEAVSFSDYSIIVNVSNPSYATISGTTVTPTNTGTFDVYVTLIVDGIRTTFTKTVLKRYSDSFVVSGIKASTDPSILSLYDGTVGGRTGVYQFSETTQNWDTGFAISSTKQTGTASAAATAFVNAGKKYLSFDFYLTNGSILKIMGRGQTAGHLNKVITAGSSTGTISYTSATGNDNISFYYNNNLQTTSVPTYAWCTCFIDYSNVDTSVEVIDYFEVMINHAKGIFYIDNVNYYAVS